MKKRESQKKPLPQTMAPHTLRLIQDVEKFDEITCPPSTTHAPATAGLPSILLKSCASSFGPRYRGMKCMFTLDRSEV